MIGASRPGGAKIRPGASDVAGDLELLGRLRDPFAAGARRARDKAFLEAAQGRAPLEWVVVRNRLAHLDTRNTREMAGLLEQLATRLGFRLGPGLSERVVFRELFYHGLTLLDLPEEQQDSRAEISRRRARSEVSDLLRAFGLSGAWAGRA